MSTSSSLHKVAIIGRPNVGKSTLFNAISRSRKAMVKNEPGVTRDFQSDKVTWWGHDFEIIDTGGLTEKKDLFSIKIREKVFMLLKNIDLLVVVMDGRSGLTPEDRDIIRLAKELAKPFFVVINKVDRVQDSQLVLSEFYEFGVDIYPASFEKKQGIDDIVEWIIDNTQVEKEIVEDNSIAISIIGKPNVGKSSLCNYLLKEDRMIVSNIAGTTVDAIEERITVNNQDYKLIDTAGLRRQSKREEGIEFLSSFKSKNAIDRSDIVLLLVDGLDGPSVQDAKIVNYILEKHKAVILVANKIDIATQEREEFRLWFKDMVKEKFHFFQDIPVAFISAHTGSGVKQMFRAVEDLWGKLNIRIKTSKVNDFFFDKIRKAPAPIHGTKNIKFYYITQSKQVPPSFMIFTNYPQSVTNSYRRFVVNQIKQEFGLAGVPIRIFFLAKKMSGAKSHIDRSYENEINQ